MTPRLDPLGWLLVALVGWALAFVIVALTGFGGHWRALPDDPSLAPALPRAVTTASGSALGPLDAYAAAFNRPLFFPNRKPAMAHVPGKSANDHPLDAILTSVIDTPTLKMAIVQDPKSHQSLRVREGQALGGNYGGWKLTALAPRQATFDSDGMGQATLDLRVYNGKGGEEPTRMGLTPQAVAAVILAPPRPPPQPGDAGSAGDDSASNATDTGNADGGGSDASQAAASAAADAAAQQAEQIRQRIEERRQQAQPAQPPNEKNQ
ncbi:MAG: hypothetical protein JSS41_09370 [Proteobacteria bacterium]|nr:hypothetical protein [Pseudomonadota bacterium]